MTTSPSRPPLDTDLDLEGAVNAAIAACDGDARAAVRALIVATNHQEAELRALQAEIADIVASISRGFTRGRFRPQE